MDKRERKALNDHLDTLKDYQSHLFEQGHTFWYCDAQDKEHNKPFYYYQINRSEDMATCSVCQELMKNRRKMRAIEKQLDIDLTPLYTNHKEEIHIKRMSVNSSSDFNPNYNYI